MTDKLERSIQRGLHGHAPAHRIPDRRLTMPTPAAITDRIESARMGKHGA